MAMSSRQEELMEQTAFPIADRAPQTPVEQMLAAAWRDVLHTDIPGVRANFFRLGGDSLKAVQILGRLKEKLPVPLPLPAFFATPTIEGLAETLINLISARINHAAGENDQ
jgi:acyl carrier protein